jgi:hypothetical protein
MTYLTGALYVHPLWFYKHQHENRVRSKLFVACQHVAFSLPFAAILVNCAPSGEMHNYCTPHIIKENFENLLIHRCNYILISQVYCVWQVVKTPTIILNNPVFLRRSQWPLACWDCGLESHRGHGYLSVVSVECNQVEVSATRWSLVHRSPTDCGASLCVI